MKFVTSVAFCDPAQLPALAQTADACGWDGLIVPDHVVHPEKVGSPYPYTDDGSVRWEPETPWPDPFVAIGAMSSVTERLRFYTGIYVLPMRNPFLVAKAVGTAAYLSGYRVTLGVGVGWMQKEFELLGQDFRGRGRRADEMIEILKKLWAGGMVEHRGEFYSFDPLQMSPGLTGPVPILIGGMSEAALRRAARNDGWISDVHTLEELREIVSRIRRHRQELGRPGEPTVVAACRDAVDLDGYRRLEEVGVTHVQTMPWLFYGTTGRTLEEKQDGLRRFADDVIAAWGRP